MICMVVFCCPYSTTLFHAFNQRTCSSPRDLSIGMTQRIIVQMSTGHIYYPYIPMTPWDWQRHFVRQLTTPIMTLHPLDVGSVWFVDYVYSLYFVHGFCPSDLKCACFPNGMLTARQSRCRSRGVGMVRRKRY